MGAADFAVVFTAEAEEQIQLSRDWWRANRPDSPDRFDDELAEIVDRLTESPMAAARYEDRPLALRILMKVTRNHVYYSVDADSKVVTVHGVWGGPKRVGPPLSRM